MSEDTDSGKIGRLARERGLLTESQFGEALQEHNVRRAAGSRLPLGEVLVELEFITRAQLDQLLEAQGGKKGPRQQIPGYELVRKLGEGGMGTTYLARQTSMDRLVALKVLRKDLSRNTDFVHRFQREAQLAGKLGHVNIVQAINVGAAGGYHYLAMDYVEGKTAYELMPDTGGMDEEQSLHICMQVARAIGFADGHDIVHRDIKPDNILVDTKGVARVCDFGLARQSGEESRLTQTGMAMGTPHYISPEQARGERDTDVRSDIYSLGATLYHLVTGETPFTGSTAAVVMTKHLSEQIPWPQDVNPEVSEHCCRLIEKMMAKDSGDRYQTPAELLADMELVIDGQAPAVAALDTGKSSLGRAGAVVVPPPPPPGRRRRRYRETRQERAARTLGTRALDPVEDRSGVSRPVLYGIGAGVLLLMAGGMWAVMNSGGEAESKKLTAPVTKRPPDPPGAGPSPAPDHPPGAKAKEARKMFVYAQQWWKAHPDEFDEALGKFEKVRGHAVGLLAMELEDAVKAVKQARADAVEKTFRPLSVRAQVLAAKGDFDAALAALGACPPKFAKLLAPRLKTAADGLHARAEEKLKAGIAEVEALSRDGKPAEGLAGIKKLSAVKYAPYAGTLAALKARLEKERQNVAESRRRRADAAARERLAVTLNDYDVLIMTSKFEEAMKQATTAKKKAGDALKPIEKEVAAAIRVAGLLADHKASCLKSMAALVGKQVRIKQKGGAVHNAKVLKVNADCLELQRRYKIMGRVGTREYRLLYSEMAPGEAEKLLPAFKPSGPDGQVALALQHAIRGNLAAALAAMKTAGSHPLRARYERRFKKLRLGMVEVTAEEAWKKDVVPLGGVKYDIKRAKALLAALDAFSAAHGKTKFAAAKTPEAAKLRALAEKAIEASPEGMQTRLRKLLRGKIVKFDPRTLQVELLWDFSDPRQFEDWRGGEVSTRDGQALTLRSRAPDYGQWGTAALRLPLRVTTLEFDAECEPSPDPRIGWFLQASGFRPYYRWAEGTRGFARTVHPKHKTEMRSAERKYVDFALQAGRRYRMKIEVAGGKTRWSVGGRELLSVKFGPAGEKTALAAYGTKGATVHFDNVRVVGTFDRAWLEPALKLASRPSAWRGVWRKMNGRRRLGGHVTATLDTKRGLYLAISDRLEVWGYDLRAGRWRPLSKPITGDGKSFPRAVQQAGSLYLPGKDLVMVHGNTGRSGGGPGTLSFNVPAGKWSVLGPGGATHPAVACGGGRLLRLSSGASNHQYYMACFDFATGEWKQLKPKLPPGGTYPGENTAFDAKRKRFLSFSGSDMNETWCYQPRKNEWRRLKPSFSPEPRKWQGTCYDAANDLIVMHGGVRDKALQDTWVFDAGRNSWFEIKVDPKPPKGARSVEYDPQSKSCIVWDPASGEIWALRINPAIPK